MREVGLLFVLPVLLVGCTFDAEKETDEYDEEQVGEVAGALSTDNALTPNALTPNALTPNALTPNALTPNALTPNALDPSALTSLRNNGAAGEISRQLFKYVVSCALDDSQSFTLTWDDAEGAPQAVTYWGSLGLAPAWATRGLNLHEQKWVSACLGARTNYAGVSVTISVRGTHDLATADSGERASFGVQEGAFWGNLFDSNPWMRACESSLNVTYSREHQRECAAGHWDEPSSSTLSCGIISRVGSCDSVCFGRTVPSSTPPVTDPESGFETCQGTAEVLTVYLQ
jgi:hypothetical protein